MFLKNKFSFFALCLIAIVFIYERNEYSNQDRLLPIKVTTWDALGYYLYLPSTIIYHDVRTLTFYDSIEIKYNLQGEKNNFYQFQKNKTGFYSGKYFIGVAVLQLPFFLIAHVIAIRYGEADGFSSIYQKGIAYGAMIWVFSSLIFFRRFLLKYFSDLIVGIGLILGLLATNAVQYIAIEGGQCHAWIFPLYVYLIILTESWHRNKSALKSIGIGAIVGLGILCRPTEGVMLFIPLLWGFNKNEFVSFLKRNRLHLVRATISMIAVLSLQVFYWKYTTDQWIFDVGSKWDFLTPHFRVLFGEEKGWLIYTPICWLIILGLVRIKHEKFNASVKIFMLTNIWIIIAWHVWRYGASYSTRALVQSTPIMMLPMLTIIKEMLQSKLKLLWYTLYLYFLCLNLFQIYQYNNGILHYDRNTYEYYWRVYWKSSINDEDKHYLQPETN